LPTWGQTYSYQGDTHSTAFAQTYSIESKFDKQSQIAYVVTVNFNPIEGDEDQFEPEPAARPPVVWADKETFTRIIDKDFEGTPMHNKCNRRYPTDYEEEDTHGVIVIEFNVPTLGDVIHFQRFLRRATNSTPWTFLGMTLPERTVIARDVSSGTPITEGEFTYYRVAIRVVLADEGETWDVPMKEQGFQHFLKVGGDFRLDDQGNKRLFPTTAPPEPFNLDEDGTFLPDGEEVLVTNWRVKREVDFNELPFSG
jgi:hypothetical protein